MEFCHKKLYIVNEEKHQEAKKPGSKENWGYEGKNVIIKS